MERPQESDYVASEGWIFANHIEAYYARRLSEAEQFIPSSSSYWSQQLGEEPTIESMLTAIRHSMGHSSEVIDVGVSDAT